MPRLQLLTVKLRYDELHGLPWSTLDAVLSVPWLRHIVIQSYVFCPRHFPATALLPEMLPPLTSFSYRLFTTRSHPRSYPAERSAVSAVVGNIHGSIEMLTLPSKSVSFTMFHSTVWERLRSLTLTGEYPIDLSLPLICVLASMPELCVLILAFALPIRNRQSIWPRGAAVTLPWPKLTDLTLSFPDPGDQIFAHLPASLWRLSLLCCPHHCFYKWDPLLNYPWHSPILDATDMLQVLDAVQAPSLEAFRLEYRADDVDEALLRRIVTAFPHLTAIEMHQFRAEGDKAVPVVGPNVVFSTRDPAS
ncbi:hypothetical protein BD309DRAFT_878523 [Dichomitus squalens]|nr:hypothetical protein BD309DRAFT_878523 [Dichomitus squalens]